VAIRPSIAPDDQIAALLSRYNSAILANDEDEEQKVQDEIDNMIYEVGWRTFTHLSRAMASRTLTNLHTDLNPETFYFRLVGVGEKVSLVKESSPPPKRPFYLDTSDILNLPRYSARDIFVSKKFLAIGYIAKVSVNAQSMCCKIANAMHGRAV
jgi:hypothetical protein